MERKFPVCGEFIDTYYPTVDGVVRTVDNYAKIINAESHACVIAPEQDNSYEDSFPYEVIRVRSIRLPIAEYTLPETALALQLQKELDKHDFEIFHIHSPLLLGRFAVREAHRRGIPCVATFHSKYYDDALQITGSKILAKALVKLIVSLYNRCDSVWACSQGTANTLRGYGYHGKIFVAENGTDYRYPSNPEELRQKALKHFDIPENVPVLLFVGHQIWHKNLKLVLDTSKVLADKGVTFKTVIVGCGYAAKEIQNYAVQLGLGDKVLFTGQITDVALMQGLQLASSLFFFPSVYDNAPLVVREAAAMELPSMLMKGSNAAEPTQDGFNAFHCTNDASATADRIAGLLEDKALLKQVGMNARRTIGRPWEEIMPTIREKYLEVIDEYNRTHKKHR